MSVSITPKDPSLAIHSTGYFMAISLSGHNGGRQWPQSPPIEQERGESQGHRTDKKSPRN